MKRGILAVALVSLGAAPARAQRIPECPDGKPPVFTGHPFRPLHCPKDSEPHGDEIPLSDGFPDIRDAERSSLKPLLGRWQGLVVFGGTRYETTLEIGGGGRKHAVKFSSMDYRTHIKYDFVGELKAPFWSKGPRSSTIWLAALPKQRLSGKAWIGAAPLEESRRPSLDRAVAAVFSGRPERHFVQFTLDGADRLRFIYTVLDPPRGLVSATGELSRAAPKP